MTAQKQISMIVPVLNEDEFIAATLTSLQAFRKEGHELIVVDGGSDDDTVGHAHALADQVLTAPRGRASQMHAGAHLAHGDVLWFIHADSLPPPAADQLILRAINQTGALWGRFDVRLDDAHTIYRIIEFLMNTRSRMTGIATGDQGIFIRRETYVKVGGFPQIPLMEDIAISKRLRTLARPACIHPKLTTSVRRWQQRGLMRTVLLMWRLRLAYALGADPATLARRYR